MFVKYDLPRRLLRRRYLLVVVISFFVIELLFFHHENTRSSIESITGTHDPAKISPSARPDWDLHVAIPSVASGAKERTHYVEPQDEYIAICMSVKDQFRDMNEFLTHHYYHHNITRFYIMDDGSEPPLSSFDYPGIPRSALTFTYSNRATRVSHMQLTFYNWCLERYGDRHKWMAFLDADEYIETPGIETFREVLASFDGNETIGALGINWKVHTSSELKTRPASSRKAFNTCAFDGKGTINTYIKSVVKTSCTARAANPHRFRLQNGAITVGENGDLINTVAFRTPVTRDRVGMHHYAIKSLEEFEEKVHRGNGMTDPQSRQMWEKVEYGMEKIECKEMVGYDP